MLKEDMESMGQVRLKDVEAAQQIIISISNNLELNGKIFIHRGMGDYLVV